ncbi:MAG: hypothetical protein HN703_12120 [Planctomycetaceae bacterium]|jgi:hypothetical protein|nr:hypothetical protein [Planctomycetaceae bacterium]
MLIQIQQNTDRPCIARLALTLCGMIVVTIFGALPGWTQETALPPTSQLAEKERAISQRMRELESTFLRLADLLDTTDPRRAATLRSAFEQARELEVTDRLDTIVELLENGQLLKAGTGQDAAIDRLRELLAVLESGESRKTVTDSKKKVKEFLGRINTLIAQQMGLEGTTEAGGDPESLAEKQNALEDDTQSLAKDVDAFRREAENAAGSKFDTKSDDAPQPETPLDSSPGQPSGDQPPGEKGGENGNGQEQQSDSAEQENSQQEPQGNDEVSRANRTNKRLEAARSRMQQAKEKLNNVQPKAARKDQEEALAELEAARAELEEILRQLREEEIERLLVKLETRIRDMLRAERMILRGIQQLRNNAAERTQREQELESARLGSEQNVVTATITRALTLVRDDGSAVAIPEALQQIREDSTMAAGRLKESDYSQFTQGIIEDLVASLEELLSALERAEREQQDRQQQGQARGRPAKPGEQPLVDNIAELKMLRILQTRVNGKTSRFSALLNKGSEQASETELIDALGRLAQRQERVERAAHDIATGRTE